MLCSVHASRCERGLSMPNDPAFRPVALITGASSGIGAAAGRVFAAAGYDAVLCARRMEKLEALAVELRSRHASARIEPLVCDVNSDESVAAAFARAEKQFGRIDVLVNNAGYGAYGPVGETKLDAFRAIMETNYFGVVRCTQAGLPLLRAAAKHEHNSGKRWGAAIVMISSFVGRRAVPGTSAYCASKFALEGFSEALRVELYDQRISLSVVNPGLTQTEFFDAAHGVRPSDFLSPEKGGMTPHDVARVILRAVRRPRRNRYLTFPGKAGIFTQWLAPTFVDAVMRRTWRKSRRDG